jgi:predicted TPR repeat methyltransferase
MIDEFKLSQASAKASRAQELLGNELLAEAYATIEANLIAAWINTPPRDTEGREKAWSAVHANRNHRRYLETVASHGKMAAAELKELADTAERKLRFRINLR